jgi:DNA-binding MarR family transcriptional regulator
MATSQPDTLIDSAARLRLAIVRTARRMRQEAGAELGPTTSAALGTVERLGPMTPSELADYERIKRPTATRVLRSLEEAGLVERTPAPDDGRSALISITGAGREHLQRLRKRKNAYLARRMRKLEREQVATLEQAAEILEEMLQEGRA